MNQKYNLRRNFSGLHIEEDTAYKGKIAFKTKDDTWINAHSPTVALVSVQSAFHQGIWGRMKMAAFISLLKENIKSKLNILMTEKAHLRVDSLSYQKSLSLAFEQNQTDAINLVNSFETEFQECNIHFMHDYIEKDPYYEPAKKEVAKRLEKDSVFSDLLFKDAKSSYTPIRKAQFSNESLYLAGAIEDIKEQCIYTLIFAQKGIRYVFYPGAQNQAVEYLNGLLHPLIRVNFIHVFISIEKKSEGLLSLPFEELPCNL